MVSAENVSHGWRHASFLGGATVVALLVNGFTAQWLSRMAYLPADHWSESLAVQLSPFAPFLLIVPFGLAPLGLAVFSLNKSASVRALAVATMLLIVVIGVGSIPLGWRLKPGETVRLAGLERIMMNGRPVIEAIERYHAATGEYPISLDALIPEFMGSLPGTGNTIFSSYEFRHAGEGSKIPSYELFVRTPYGMLNWDEFIYRPEHTYPAEHPGGPVERVGDWAYIHE
jgi:hypothetical protein